MKKKSYCQTRRATSRDKVEPSLPLCSGWAGNEIFPVPLDKGNEGSGNEIVIDFAISYWTARMSHLELLLTTGAISTAVAGSPTSKGLETACQLSFGASLSLHIITYMYSE